MQMHSSYPLARPAVGLLDPTASLLALLTLEVTPAVMHNLTCADPSSLLRTNLPPLAFLLLADRLAELYEMVFSDHPEWLGEEVAHWQREEDVATAVERFLKRMSALFPVHDEIWDVDPSAGSEEAIEVVEWRLWEIPLILMLDHNTDNAWLDVGELSLAEGGGYPPWNPDEVAWLTAEWQKAQPVLNRIHRLLDWQNGAPEEIAFKLTAVRDVLLDAYHRAQQAEESATEVIP